MFLLLSGEGPSDIGICDPSADWCSGEQYIPGPMALFIDQLIEQFQGFEMSHLAIERVMYVSEHYLASQRQPAQRKAMSLKGKKKPAETKYYFENARTLAALAKQKSQEINDTVIAVLFRDADGTASAGRGDWQHKRESMLQGFAAQDFDFGVAMVPKPKSEAWLLCALKPNPYQDCAALEQMSGNDSAPDSLKKRLSALHNGPVSSQALREKIIEHQIDVSRIQMPSFDLFKADLARAVRQASAN